jgi:RND family efflux transporter MFP subunit
LARVVSWKFALAFLIVPAVAGCAWSIAEPPAEEEHEAAVTVRVEPAEYRTLPQVIKTLGQCEAVVGKLAMLTPALEGHVHAILVEQGASVKAGQPIIELDTSLPAADLAEKTAAGDAAKASLALLKSLPRSQEQQITKLAIEQADVAYQRAKSVLDSLKPLAERNEVSRQQLFDAEKAAEHARLLMESAQAAHHVSVLGPRDEAAAEAQARVKMAEQAAKTSQVRLDLHTLRAPIDGVLQDITCQPGQTIAPGTPVGEIVDASQVEIVAWLSPRLAREVHAGQKVAVSLVGAQSPAKAEDDSTAKPQGIPSATVVFVGRIADAQTGNLSVRCRIENAEGQLAIGQTVNLEITLHEGVKALSVPVAAVFDLGEGPVVSVVRDEKIEQLHPKLGLAHEGWIAISDVELEEGEGVVVAGGYNLEDGTPVKLAEGDPEQPETEPEKADAQPDHAAEKGPHEHD